MAIPFTPPPMDVERAKEVWAEYQRQHDVAALKGQVVGIDPMSGEVHFGKSITEIGDRLRAEGRHKPLYFLRVGKDYYGHKGRWRQR